MEALRKLWRWWKKVARKIGDIQARIVLGIFYFVLLAPLCFVVRSTDPLAIRSKARKGWLTKAPTDGNPMERALQQS